MENKIDYSKLTNQEMRILIYSLNNILEERKNIISQELIKKLKEEYEDVFQEKAIHLTVNLKIPITAYLYPATSDGDTEIFTIKSDINIQNEIEDVAVNNSKLLRAMKAASEKCDEFSLKIDKIATEYKISPQDIWDLIQ
jgi:hypothetical protein